MVELSVDPGNLTTANHGALVRVIGGTPFGAVDTSWVETGVELQSGAAHDPVSFTSALQGCGAVDAASICMGFAGVPNQGFVFGMTPAPPLPPGWYSVVLAPPNGGFQFVGQAPEGPATAPTHRADGKYESRFRVGSSPMLLAVAACASNDLQSLPKLIFSFSEAVDIPAPPPVHVSVDGVAPNCVVYDSSQKTSLNLGCSPEMPAAARITVSISEGVVATGGGSALHDAAGATTMTVELPAATTSVPCRTWRETRAPGL